MNNNPIEIAKSVQVELVTWRRDLHQMPEIGIELPQTVAYVTQILEQLGINYDASYVNGNGIVALIEGKNKGNHEKVIALRADMDGLPIQEETGLPFAAKENMHACGHDGHTAILLATAKVLQENRERFAGKVKLIFQPGEEYPGAAKIMVEEGVLEDPKVDRIFGLHIGQLVPNMEKGSLASRPGPLMASMDRFKITILGKGYHAAFPDQAQDPIVAAAQLITTIQTIHSRNINPLDPAVISITRIEGGVNQNVIPDAVEIEGTVRTFDEQVRQSIKVRLAEICQGLGQALHVTCELDYSDKYPPLLNHREVTNNTLSVLKSIFGNDQAQELAHPLMSAEDFAFYLAELPGCFFYLANPGLIEGQFHGHHHPKFDLDESELYRGVAAFYSLCLDYLNN